jgi:hypothetical protein
MSPLWCMSVDGGFCKIDEISFWAIFLHFFISSVNFTSFASSFFLVKFHQIFYITKTNKKTH